MYTTLPAPKHPILAQSQMFDRFTYNDHKDLKVRSTRKSVPSRKKPDTHSTKNIEVIFCENKFPSFVQKTNTKIEEIYKKEQVLEKNKSIQLGSQTAREPK